MAQMKYFYELTISSSPHAHSPVTTQTIMRDVLIALVPALLGSIYFFGFRALLVTLVSAAACVFFEWGFCKVRKLHCKTYDLSAVVTGVLLAFVCPVTLPYWVLIIGDFFAIVVVKQLFGGLGYNFANPAIVGRIALAVGFAGRMADYPKPENGIDALASATPLAVVDQLGSSDYLTLLLGNHGAVTMGTDLDEAWGRMEMLEQLCKVSFITDLLGGPREFTPQELQVQLEEIAQEGIVHPGAGKL